jgi:hypothetical protein
VFRVSRYVSLNFQYVDHFTSLRRVFHHIIAVFKAYFLYFIVFIVALRCVYIVYNSTLHTEINKQILHLIKCDLILRICVRYILRILYRVVCCFKKDKR